MDSGGQEGAEAGGQEAAQYRHELIRYGFGTTFDWLVCFGCSQCFYKVDLAKKLGNSL